MRERIKARRKEVGLSQEDLAKRIGLTKGSISQWEQGGTQPKGENLYKLASALGVTAEWLIHGDKGAASNVARLPSAHHSNVKGQPFPVGKGRVPVKGNAQLGPQGYFEALDYPAGCGDGYIRVESDDADAYGLRVVGNSMMPRIKHNEYVVIEPNHAYVTGDEVFVCTHDGQCMIKIFIWLRDGQYRFDSINNDFEPLYILESEVEKIHYVGAIAKPSRYTP